ncbi:MAG: HAMP domain-containing sensor histidine kinase, partial [Bacteroidales bacterium]
ELQAINKELMTHKEKLEFLNDELNQTNQKLVESEKKLLATNSSKDKFFSIISHDLRNPFASIASFSRIIKRDIDVLSKEDLKELAVELDKSIIKINNLLDNLLVWSRSQSGRTVFQPQYLNISHIIEDSIEFIEGSITEKDVKVHNKISDDLVVYADKNMLDSIIRNLLTNAIKYSKIGGEISLNAEIKDNKAFISIADQGVGIPEENKSKILNSEIFFSTYGTKDEKGSGLGLHITKEFVKKHGGEIFFESEEGKGTVFTFSLPLEEEQI